MKFAIEDEDIEGEAARLKGREIEWGQELTRQP
jgi:hypothetical protein